MRQLASVRAIVQYRRERRWLERDPYGYLRFALGLPPDATEAEIDAALLELGRIGRHAGVSAEEFAEGLRRVFTA